MRVQAPRTTTPMSPRGRAPAGTLWSEGCAVLRQPTPKAPSPQDVGAERCALVDVLRQPPLHRHVPIPHALPHTHAEVCVVAVDVSDGLIVVLQDSRLLQTGGGDEGEETRSSARPSHAGA